MKKTIMNTLPLLLMLLLFNIVTVAKTSDKPNVILVLVDDMGRGDMGCYGNKLIKTPHLDAFYKEAVRFNNFHVSPTCAPSRSSFMTGKYYHQVGVHATVEGREMPFAHEQMMPDVFAKNGYKTALFGKWHLGDAYPFRPEDRGFQHVVGIHGGGVSQSPDYFGNDYFNDTYWVNGKLQEFSGFCTDVWFEEATKFIKQSAKEKKPFFAYISTNAPHGPFRAPKKYLDMYDPLLTPAPFYGMITNIDDNFGELVQLLKTEGIEDNTILIFTSDNGSNIGTYYFDGGMRGKKGSVYEGGHKVPFLLRWPKAGLQGGREINAMTSHVDLLPTFIDLLGFEKTKVDYSGHSFKPVIDGNEKAIADRSLVVTSWSLDEWEKTAVLQDKWRLVEKKELYNIEEDPMQYHNIIKKHPEVVSRLDAIYMNYRKKVQDDPISYFVLGSEKQNPMWLNCHDIREDREKDHEQPPVGHSTIVSRPLVKEAPWMVHIEKEGNYEISIRRFPAELDQEMNQKYKNPSSDFESKNSDLKAKKVYINIAGVQEEKEIPAGAKEVTFKVRLPKKDSVQFWAGYVYNGKRYAAHYAYILNADIYKGDLSSWQTQKGLGVPQAKVYKKDMPKFDFQDPRKKEVKHRRLPPYTPKEGQKINAKDIFAWSSSTSYFEGVEVHYLVEIAKDKDFTSIVLSKDHIKEQSIALEALGDIQGVPQHTTLYMRLRAFSKGGDKTDYSTPVSFTYL